MHFEPDADDFYLPPPSWEQPRRRGRWKVFLGFLLVSLVLCGVLVLDFYRRMANREPIDQVGRMPQRSLVFDHEGREIGRLHGVNRVVVPVEQVSPLFLDALLAREDSRFFRHDGIDYRGVARAIVRNMKDGRFTQGASTITMQLARVSFDIREKSLHRKLLEAMLARRIEQHYTKNEILGHYVNRIFLGTGLYGVERACQAYFGKSANALTLGEAAMLAGIIRAPNRFSPFRHYEAAKEERDMVLERMLHHGFVTPEEVAMAKAQEIAIRSQEASRTFQNSFALDIARRDLELILEKQDTEDGGLLIYTTLDKELQAEAEKVLEARLRAVEGRPGYAHQTREAYRNLLAQGAKEPPKYLQGALVAIDNASGGVRALVGGRDFAESSYNRATMSQREIGSLFKPFVYAAAYRNGLLPGTLVNDGPIGPGEVAWDPGNWSPGNADGEFRGMLPAQDGLTKSRNTMTVRVGETAGIDAVMKMVRTAGFQVPEEVSPQVYIGNLGADLKTVTSAFSAFANDGWRHRPYVIESIRDRRGNVIYQNAPVGYRALPESVAWLTNQNLQKVMGPGGTGAASRSLGLRGPAGGKTGTTNDYRDAWFVGYTDKLTCGVWVGLDQPKRIVWKGYGSTLALPVWTDFMAHATANGFPAEPFRSEVSLTRVEVCRTTGLLANQICQRQGHSYPVDLPFELVPQAYCDEHGGLRLARKPRIDPTETGFLGRIRELFR